MSDGQQPEVVGREGKSSSVDQAAQQIAAVERQGNLRIDSLGSSTTQLNDAIRREIDLHIAHAREMNAEKWAAHVQLHEQEEEAVRVALNSLDKRLDGVNEFRGQLNDVIKTLATQAELHAAKERVARFEEDTRRRFEIMEANLRDRMEQTGERMRAGSRVGEDTSLKIGTIVAFIIAVVTIAAALFAVVSGLR